MADIPPKSDGSSSDSDSFDPLEEIARAELESLKNSLTETGRISEDMVERLKGERPEDAQKMYYDYFEAARDLSLKLYEEIEKRNFDKDWMRSFIEQLRTWVEGIEAPAILAEVDGMIEALKYNDIGSVKSALQNVEQHNKFLYVEMNSYFERVGAGGFVYIMTSLGESEPKENSSEESESKENSSEESESESKENSSEESSAED